MALTGTSLAWTAPTQYANNNDPLLPGAITGYNIWVGSSAADVADVVAHPSPALTVGPTTLSVPFTSIPGADLFDWFQVSATTAAAESARTAADQWVSAGAPLRVTAQFVLF